jgi:hypothetical protein
VTGTARGDVPERRSPSIAAEARAMADTQQVQNIDKLSAGAMKKKRSPPSARRTTQEDQQRHVQNIYDWKG